MYLKSLNRNLHKVLSSFIRDCRKLLRLDNEGNFFSRKTSGENFVRVYTHNSLDKTLMERVVTAFLKTNKNVDRQVINIESAVRNRNILVPTEVGSVISLLDIPTLSTEERIEIDGYIAEFIQQTVFDYINRIPPLLIPGVQAKDTNYLVCQWNYGSRAWISPFVIKKDRYRVITIIIPILFPEGAGIHFRHFGFVPFKKAGSAIAFPALFTHEFGFVNPASSTDNLQPILCIETHIEFKI